MVRWTTDRFLVVTGVFLFIAMGRSEGEYGEEQDNEKQHGEVFTSKVINRYRERVKRMFYHAYNGYLNYAYPLDELKPITCRGHDTWGSFSLTLVDSLDTLLIMGNASEFRRAVDLVLQSVRDDANVNVSVFETNIRVVGGLIAAHMLIGLVPELEKETPGWPCDGPLLKLAVKMADRLLPAFNTETGMPYGTVNLRYGVHKEETPVTCTAGVGTYIIEFGALSRLTGDDKYERVAMKALDSLWSLRSPIGLVGNHLNVVNGQWTATDAGIGAGIDSYFEYLAKGAMLFQRPSLMVQFNEYLKAVNKHVRRDNWFMWVSMTKGTVSMPVFQSLEAFWPGLLTLVGDLEDAQRIMMQYSKVIRQYGFPPEFYNIPNSEPVDKRAAYPLRPEMAESLMYLYRATGDHKWLELGAEMIDAIDQSARTKCGYATINNVKDHSIEDRMESFFLAETTKYLYLLFDPDNFIHADGSEARLHTTKENTTCALYAGGYVFNTEAHPIDPGILQCCSSPAKRRRKVLRKWETGVDMMNVVKSSGMGSTSHQIHKDDVEGDGKDKQRQVDDKGGDKYMEKHYGSDAVVEFEVDEQMKKEAEERKTKAKRAATAVRKSFLAEFRKQIRQAILDDEEKRKRGEYGDHAGELLAEIAVAYPKYKKHFDELVWQASEEIAEKSEIRKVIRSIPIPEAHCQGCCWPVEELVNSVLLRFMLADIYEFHVYPARGTRFVLGPVCWSEDEPRIEDDYKNEPPTLPKLREDEEGDAYMDEFTDFAPDDVKHLGYANLRSSGPGFFEQFVGGGYVNTRVASSAA